MYQCTEKHLDRVVRKCIKNSVASNSPLDRCTVTKEARKAVENALYSLPDICEKLEHVVGLEAFLIDQQIVQIRAALEAVSREDGYSLLLAKYLENASMRELAHIGYCDMATTWRKISPILDVLAIHLFGVFAYRNSGFDYRLPYNAYCAHRLQIGQPYKTDRQAISKLLYDYPALCERYRESGGEEHEVLQRQIERIQMALECVKQDPHYSIIPAKYFARAKIREIADMCSCDPSTVWRRCNTLLDTIAFNYSEVDEWEEETKT